MLITRSVVAPVRALRRRLRSLDEHCLQDLTTGLEAAAAGDLTVEVHPVTKPIDVRATDEVGQLAQTFNAMLEKAQRSIVAYGAMRAELGSLLGEVSRSAGTVSAGSQQVASSSEDAGRAVAEIASAVTSVARGAERQVRMVASTRGAVLEANQAAAASAAAAAATAAAAEEAREVAREGVAAAASATDAIQSVAAASASVGAAIEDLSARSEKIGGIVTTITGLAEQTNLLALNAAIEAARAGEQGRGFAVVAEEVRKLAEESQRAAAEIETLIGEMQEQTRQVVGVVADGAARTDEGVATVERTREAFLLIDQAVEGVGAQIASIAAAVEQISAGSSRAEGDVAEVAAVAEQSSASAEQVSASTQQTSASTQEIAASAARPRAHGRRARRARPPLQGHALSAPGIGRERRRRARPDRVQQQPEIARPVVVHRAPVRSGPGRRPDHPEHHLDVLGHEVVADGAGLLGALERARDGAAAKPARCSSVSAAAPMPLRDDVVEALVGRLHPRGAVEELGERLAGVRLLVDLGGEPLDLAEDVLEDRPDERLLGGEAPVQRALPDPGAARDLLHPDVQPGLRERRPRGIQDAGAISSGIGPQRPDVSLHRRRSYPRIKCRWEILTIGMSSEPVRSVRGPWRSWRGSRNGPGSTSSMRSSGRPRRTPAGRC